MRVCQKKSCGEAEMGKAASLLHRGRLGGVRGRRGRRGGLTACEFGESGVKARKGVEDFGEVGGWRVEVGIYSAEVHEQRSWDGDARR